MDRNQASSPPQVTVAAEAGAEKSSLMARRMIGAGSVAVLAVLGCVLPAAATATLHPGATAELPAFETAAHSSTATISHGSSGSGTPKGLQLVSQSSWVKPGQMFDLTLAVTSSVPGRNSVSR